MPRYHFHFVSTERTVPDQDGAELPSMAAAYRHAQQLIMQTAHLIAASKQKRWRIGVADESGRIFLAVLFAADGVGRDEIETHLPARLDVGVAHTMRSAGC